MRVTFDRGVTQIEISTIHRSRERLGRVEETIARQHRGQTFAHARVVVRAELSTRTKTEEKYTSERLHKALEKRVNKITRG